VPQFYITVSHTSTIDATPLHSEKIAPLTVVSGDICFPCVVIYQYKHPPLKSVCLYYTEWHFNGSLLKYIFMSWFFSVYFITFLTSCTKSADYHTRKTNITWDDSQGCYFFRVWSSTITPSSKGSMFIMCLVSFCLVLLYSW
jgi:hypothetical protein